MANANIGDQVIAPSGNLWTVILRFEPTAARRLLENVPDDGSTAQKCLGEFAHIIMSAQSMTTLPYEAAQLSHVMMARTVPSEIGREPDLILTSRPASEVDSWVCAPFDVNVGDRFSYMGDMVTVRSLHPAIAVMEWDDPEGPALAHFVLQRWVLPILRDTDHPDVFDAPRRRALEAEL